MASMGPRRCQAHRLVALGDARGPWATGPRRCQAHGLRALGGALPMGYGPLKVPDLWATGPSSGQAHSLRVFQGTVASSSSVTRRVLSKNANEIYVKAVMI